MQAFVGLDIDAALAKLLSESNRPKLRYAIGFTTLPDSFSVFLSGNFSSLNLSLVTYMRDHTYIHVYAR